MKDPRVLRRFLVLRMADEADTKAAFTNSMQVTLQEQAALGSALLPMEISAEVYVRLQPNIRNGHEHWQLVGYSCWTPKACQSWLQGVPMTGDSLIRLLLNLTGIQTALACALVQKLPEAMEAQGSQEAGSMPRRILGSLRWYLAGALQSAALPLLMSCHTHNSLPAIDKTHTLK